MKTALMVVQTVICLAIIFVVLLQPAKVQGLSSAIAGGAETFFGRNKARTYEGKLSKLTTILMILFVLNSMFLVYLLNK